MKVLHYKKINDFIKKHNQAKTPLLAIYQTLRESKFNNGKEITEAFPRSSSIRNNKIVFRIKGNDFRMIIRFDYFRQIGKIEFIGTHAEYDKI